MRLGTDWGLTLQQRVAKKTTVELIYQGSLQREELMLSALLEQHYPIITRRLNIYFGGGLHKGWLDTGFNDEPNLNPFGVSLIGGIEFNIGRINLSYDLKPAFNISGGEEKFYKQTGVSLRYVLVKRKWEVFNKKNSKKQKGRAKINWKIWETF